MTVSKIKLNQHFFSLTDQYLYTQHDNDPFFCRKCSIDGTMVGVGQIWIWWKLYAQNTEELTEVKKNDKFMTIKKSKNLIICLSVECFPPVLEI